MDIFFKGVGRWGDTQTPSTSTVELFERTTAPTQMANTS